jgi:glycosyltransferase involved in cell wall biosynthesis
LQIDIGPKLGRRSLVDFAFRWVSYRSRLRRFLEDCVQTHRIELVHLQFKKEQLLGSAAARAAGVAVVWTEHDRLPVPFAALPPAIEAYRRAASLSRAILCVSEFVRRDLVRNGVPAERLTVCHNGIDPLPPPIVADRIRARALLGVPDDALVIGTTGRLTPIKGHHHLLDAVPGITARFPDVHVVIIGDGPARPDLEQQARRLGTAAGRLRFLGHRADVRTLLPALDLHVTASSSEGLPFTVIEAMAAGVPVIATSVGGMPELVGDAGILVEPGDAHAIVRAAIRLMSDPGEVARIGQAGRARVVADFTTDRMLTTTEAVFHDAAGCTGNGPVVSTAA